MATRPPPPREGHLDRTLKVMAYVERRPPLHPQDFCTWEGVDVKHSPARLPPQLPVHRGNRVVLPERTSSRDPSRLEFSNTFLLASADKVHMRDTCGMGPAPLSSLISHPASQPLWVFKGPQRWVTSAPRVCDALSLEGS